MFFAGRLPRPPWETRSRIEATRHAVRSRAHPNLGDRFRFATLQSRYATFIDLWDRGLRAREEGRRGPVRADAGGRRRSRPKRPEDRILHVRRFAIRCARWTSCTDLYDSLAEARREVGEDAVPFHKFVDLVKTQVKKLRAAGTPEVAFRVAVKDGKVNFTARALKGVSERGGARRALRVMPRCGEPGIPKDARRLVGG